MNRPLMCWYAIGMWLASGAFWANVITLVPHNADYRAAWWKVAAFAGMFIWFMCGLVRAATPSETNSER